MGFGAKKFVNAVIKTVITDKERKWDEEYKLNYPQKYNSKYEKTIDILITIWNLLKY